MAQSDFTIDVGGITDGGSRLSRGHGASDPGLRDKAQRRAGRSDTSRSLGTISKSRLMRRASAFAATRASAAVASLGARAAALTRVGTVGGALAVGIGLGAKLTTGRSFEGLSEGLADRLFGDKDDYSRAQRITRERILGNETLLYAVAANGTDAAMPTYEALVKQEFKRQKARSAILKDTDYEVKDELDILIDGMRDGVMGAWAEIAGDAKDLFSSLRGHRMYSQTLAGQTVKAIKAIFGGSR